MSSEELNKKLDEREEFRELKESRSYDHSLRDLLSNSETERIWNIYK